MGEPAESSWNFELPFHFSSECSLEQVVNALANLAEDGSFFSASHNDILIQPQHDGYTFRYYIRRRNRQRLYTTGVGKGQIWQEEDGSVIVEGQAQIEHWGLYGMVALFSAAIIFGSIVSRGSFGFIPLFLLAACGFMIFHYYSDRNLVVDRIGEAVANAYSMPETIYGDKAKRGADSEDVRNMRLSMYEPIHSHSLWNDTISEYDSIKKE